jgi:hypothetical protein
MSQITALPITIAQITDLPSWVATIDPTADVLEIVDVSTNASYKITRNQLLGITGSPVGTSDAQNLGNKTIGNSCVITVKDGSLTIQNAADTTKQAMFSLSGITTGTTRTYTLPNYNATFASLAGVETLTNKTITAPAITGGTIDNTAITVDSISGHTSGSIVSVAGLSISSGVLNTDNSVKTSNYQNASVTADKLKTGAATALVAASEATASTSPVDLATSGPTVVATIGANGLALVIVSADCSNSGSGNFTNMYLTASGANTINANGVNVYSNKSAAANSDVHASYVGLLAGLNPGSTSFKAKYSVSSGTGTWSTREISVIPL